MKKMNNKGFSLVELIIVIAIMAILIVVLAPQYLKYVERSRNSTDLQSATEFKDACEVYAADPEAEHPFVKGDTFTIKCENTTVTLTDTGDNSVAAALADTGLEVDAMKCQSRTRWSYYTITGTVQTSGAIEWSYPDADNDGTEFKDAITNTKTPAGP